MMMSTKFFFFFPPEDAWAASASLLRCKKTLQKWECGMCSDDLDKYDCRATGACRGNTCFVCI